MPDTKRLQEHFYLKVNGALNDALMADQLEVIVDSSLQLPDMATITVHDTKLKWIDDRNLDPGKSIQIAAKSEAGSQDLFDGEIVELEPDFRTGDQRLVIRAFDKMHRLTRGKYSRTFQNVTDGDMVKKVCSEAGLSAETGATSIVYDHVYQHNQTNLDFIRVRAARLGFVIYMSDGKLQFKPPTADGPEIELQWGDTLMEFRPRLTTVDQVSEDVVRGWNYKERSAVMASATEGDGAPAIGESRSGRTLAQPFGTAKRLTADHAIRTQAEAEARAKAMANQRASESVEAEGLARGDPRIIAGSKIKLTSVGKRFSGTYTVTNARHVMDHAQHGYTTEFSISGHHSPALLSALSPETNFWMPDRVVIGVVTNNDDPDGMGRVKVKFPWLSPDDESWWARVVSMGAGDKRGIAFIPEINDEVLVAFELGDMNQPYILGGLWNGKDKLPKSQGDLVSGSKVQQRVIYSRTGHKIEFDDKDGAGGITIEDRKGNVMRLESDSDKLVVKTTGNIEVETKADLKIKATGNVNIEAQQEMELKASMGITMDGGMKVDVKGQMVSIN